MTDSRKRRGAKQNRRAPKRQRTNTDDDILMTAVRKALAKHPVYLLSLASCFIAWATPEPGPSAKRTEAKLSLESLLVSLAERRCRETTALLAVFAEMLIDDDLLRERCRQEVSTRHAYLPKWIVGLPHIEVGRVMRRSDVLGDGDELAIGLRLAGATELTLGAFLDHNDLSAVTDFTVLMDPLEKALVHARERIDPGTTFVEMDPADARSWLERGIVSGNFLPHEDGWREGLPLVRWLLAQLPSGGTAYEGPDLDDDAISELLDGFFTSLAGAPFTDVGYRDLLLELCATGCGDPWRWSATRISRILRYPLYDDRVPLEIALDAPGLLRAFVPFAHADSGVRQDLTDDAIAAIDEMSLRYKRTLLAEAAENYDFDPPSWRTYPDRAS